MQYLGFLNIGEPLINLKSVLFGHKQRISATGITFNNPGIIDLFSYKIYGYLIRLATKLLIIIPEALIVHLCQNSTLLTLLKVHLRVSIDLAAN